MNQTAFMIVVTLLGTLGVFIAPILGVWVYYFFAVLRPQALWDWALPPGTPWSFYSALGTMLAMAIHLMGLKAPPNRHPGFRAFAGPHLILLLFAIWLTLSYWLARSQEVAWPWYLEYQKMFLMFFVSAILIQTLQHLWVLMILTAGALGYIAYEVNFEYLATGNVGIVSRGYAGLDNNGAGLMLAMAIPLCVYIYFGTARWWRWIFAGLIPVILHAVLMTYSRGAMVALLVAAPFVFFRRRHRVQLSMAAIAIAVLVPVLAGDEIRKEFYSIDTYEEDGSAQSRFASWTAAFEIAKDYPLVGVGIRNSDLVSFHYGADRPGRTIHNQYLQTLADSGIPALALYLAMITSVALSIRRVRRWAVNQPTADGRLAYGIACGIEGSLLVYYVGVLFLSLDGFEVPVLLWLMGAQLPLVLGLGVARDARPESVSVLPIPPAAVAPAVIPPYRPLHGPTRRPLPRPASRILTTDRGRRP